MTTLFGLEEETKRRKTAGEVAFDRIVYTGIGFGVNEVSSLVITDQFMHGRNIVGKWFSKEGFDAASAGIARTFKIKDKLDPSGRLISAEAKGGNLLLMVTLLSGGTLLILPMKWLEDNKIKWVEQANHWIDCLRGNKLSREAVEARDDEVAQAIACSHKQSWPSMLLGRVIACTASVSTGTFLVGPKNNERLMNWGERFMAGSMQAAGQQTFWHRQARLLPVETYSCATSSIVLELASKLFARKGELLHDAQLCRSAAEEANGNSAPTDRKFSDQIQPKTKPVPSSILEKISRQQDAPPTLAI